MHYILWEALMRVEKGLLKNLDKSEKFSQAHLVLYFAPRDEIEKLSPFETLKKKYPQAVIAGCSSQGVILDDILEEWQGVYLAVTFKTSLVCPRKLKMLKTPTMLDMRWPKI
jgi:hypothetical protein